MKRGLRNGVAPYISAAFCRDAGSAGHGATEAARPERSLQARGLRQGGDSFAGSVHDSPPRQGDARERHRQENNRTDSNQGSSNQNQNRKKKRIITGKVMSFLTTGHKQRRRAFFSVPEGKGPSRQSGCSCPHNASKEKGTAVKWTNRQSLHKGASVQSGQHQP